MTNRYEAISASTDYIERRRECHLNEKRESRKATKLDPKFFRCIHNYIKTPKTKSEEERIKQIRSMYE
jgi:hypothetical protein